MLKVTNFQKLILFLLVTHIHFFLIFILVFHFTVILEDERKNFEEEKNKHKQGRQDALQNLRKEVKLKDTQIIQKDSELQVTIMYYRILVLLYLTKWWIRIPNK